MRLIDADELTKDIEYSADMGGVLGKVVECVKYYAKYMVASSPTIEERKKGKWIRGKCDQCGARAPFWPMASTYYESDFCPNCGADMRGEGHE